MKTTFTKDGRTFTRISSEQYFVRSTNDLCGLSHGVCMCENDCIMEIITAVKRARRMGYEPHEKWIIVCEERYRIFDEDGTFVSEEIYRGPLMDENGKTKIYSEDNLVSSCEREEE